MTDIYIKPDKPPTTKYSMTAAAKSLGELTRRAYLERERVLITYYGHPMAVLMNPYEIGEIEAQAVAHRNCPVDGTEV